MPAAYIDDGYTRDDVIAATNRHPQVHITYRPMLAAERRRLTLQTVRLSAQGETGIDAATQLVVSALAARLVQWNVIDTSGKVLAISPETVAGLEPNLFEKVYAAVAGFDD